MSDQFIQECFANRLRDRINELQVVVTDAVHAGIGYDIFEFCIDRVVADIATLPVGIQELFILQLHWKLLCENEDVRDLCRYHHLTPDTMPRWNQPSPIAAHAALPTLRTLIRTNSANPIRKRGSL